MDGIYEKHLPMLNTWLIRERLPSQKVGWSKESKKDFKDFSIRLDEDLKRLEQLNVNYRKK